eukprot:GHVO01017380.1.p1 GENE.GHVO01017380.1~~GHVO01017380.1.p1  ORF type:complete len:291 (+),score=38.93 GHVO01017380.1:669-1541(+)
MFPIQTNKMLRKETQRNRFYHTIENNDAKSAATHVGKMKGDPRRQRCAICAGYHSERTCPNRRCFHCYAVDHELLCCPKKPVKCRKCFRYHIVFDPDVCFRNAVEDSIADESSASNFEEWKIRCITCGAKGHPVCGNAQLLEGAPPKSFQPRRPRKASRVSFSPSDSDEGGLVPIIRLPKSPKDHVIFEEDTSSASSVECRPQMRNGKHHNRPTPPANKRKSKRGRRSDDAIDVEGPQGRAEGSPKGGAEGSPKRGEESPKRKSRNKKNPSGQRQQIPQLRRAPRDPRNN